MKVLLIGIAQNIVMSIFSALLNSEAGEAAFAELEKRILESPNKVDDFFLVFLRAVRETLRKEGPMIEKEIMEVIQR
jgi:hypothetical protein